MANRDRNMPEPDYLQRLLAGEITPELIRRGTDIDWRFYGDFNTNLYRPEPIVGEFVDPWEGKVAAILSKHAWGMWILDGPKGSGKTGMAVTCAFYFHHLFGRPVASNFPVKPAFGPCRYFTLDEVKDQLDRLHSLGKVAGTADWQSLDLGSYNIWLPGHIILDDEFHREVGNRRTMTDENLLITNLTKEIRHYDITWLGLTPDKEELDSKKINNPLFMSTEVRCSWEADELTGRQYIRGVFYQNEQTSGSGWQRVSGPPDVMRVDVARFCNLWWTKGAISGGAKLNRDGKEEKKMKLADGVAVGAGDGVEVGDEWEDVVEE